MGSFFVRDHEHRLKSDPVIEETYQNLYNRVNMIRGAQIVKSAGNRPRGNNIEQDLVDEVDRVTNKDKFFATWLSYVPDGYRQDL